MSEIAGEKGRSGVFDASAIRADFPLLCEKERVQALHYLDNAATTQKPSVVIEAIADCYRSHYGPVHRGLYALAEDATARYERARSRIAQFIGANSDDLIFTRSATESINMVAQGWARRRLQPGDVVWVSRMEHHANFLPWWQVCRETGAELRIIELKPDGTLDLEGADGLYGSRTRLIALTHVSNVLGVINPVKEVIDNAGQKGIQVLVDGAQSVGHMPISVNDMNCDFLAFSAHKMFGPSGIGALYAKPERLSEMEPLLYGGGMVDQVGEAECCWMPYPAKFEAGSPALADAIGFAAAVDYIDRIGMEAMHSYVWELTQTAVQKLSHLDGLELYGPKAQAGCAGILAFNIEGVHPHDVGQIAGEMGVAIRAGHHCCQPLMQYLGVAATVRASFAPYNAPEDVDALVEAISEAQVLFR